MVIDTARGSVLRLVNREINFRQIEADSVEIEVQIAQLLKLERQVVLIEAGLVRDPIVGNEVGAALVR